jgi:hypothetical protein
MGKKQSMLAYRGNSLPVCRVAGNATGEPSCNLLQQPAVAVRVAEGSEGTVAGVIRLGAAEATAYALWMKLSTWNPGGNTSPTSTPRETIASRAAVRSDTTR